MSFGSRLSSSIRAPRPVAPANGGSNGSSTSFEPCPFCQEASILIRQKSSEKGVSYQAKCEACGAMGPRAGSPAEAKAFWNERVSRVDSSKL